MKKIILAGGCFWGIEAYFKRIKGVLKTQVGYTNGVLDKPSYREVCSGETGHVEAVEIYYDEPKLKLEKILKLFFGIIDPTSLNKQGNDKGTQYGTGIFYSSYEDKDIVVEFIKLEQEKYSQKIEVIVGEEQEFYLAEEYHQEYLEKNPKGYCHINLSSINESDYQQPVKS